MKNILLITLIAFSIMLTACGNESTEEESQASSEVNNGSTVKFENYDIWLTAPKTWYENDDDFDLSMSESRFWSLLAFGYNADQYSDSTVEELFEDQNDLMLELYEITEVVEETKVTELEDRVIYTAKYNGKESEYDTGEYIEVYMVNFKESGKCAWIMFSGIESYIKTADEEVAAIVDSVREVEVQE